MKSTAEWRLIDLWLSSDQQGRYYFEQGDYETAAERFENTQWKAISYYAKGDFTTAAQLFSLGNSVTAKFNQANALAHQGLYRQAADLYYQILALHPSSQTVTNNLQLMEALLKEPAISSDSESGKYRNQDADATVYDLSSEHSKSATEVELTEVGLNQSQIHALWMRRFNTSPAQFLRAKFHFQLEKEKYEKTASDNSAGIPNQ
jgi:Ca-activated chloride channel family protein